MVEARPFLLPRKTPFGILESVAERICGLKKLDSLYQQRPEGVDCDNFLTYTLQALGISHQIVKGSLESIPESGPVIVVANHPLGGVEGVILAEILRKKRNDVQVLANHFLRRIPELRELFIGVDVFETANAMKANIRALRDAHEHLGKGGVLLVFPAGSVSELDKNGDVSDKVWSHSVAKMAKRSGAAVLPVYVGGRNSRTFYRARKVHPIISTAMLGRELLNKEGMTVPLSIGELIPNKEVVQFETDEAVMNYLRLNTYLLGEKGTYEASVTADGLMPLGDAVPARVLSRELEGLPPEARLCTSDNMDVYCACASDIPNMLNEIGRVRETSFRAVGEGTGLARDIDSYDSYYHHLFIWDRENRKLVGAYRLGVVSEIINNYGLDGLYSRSLFDYNDRFLARLNQSVEVGRSVVAEEYQRSLSALLMLWKGIAAFVMQRPEHTHLFGPVSISNDYGSLVRQLMAETLSIHYYDDELAGMVAPRTPLKDDSRRFWHTDMLTALTDLQQLNRIVSKMADGKGVPVLLRQYLGLNGKLVCFNVDPDFNDALDGLIVVDLRNVPEKTLARYMGKKEAVDYLTFHNISD
ncbi:lysophospholipid acyltransferase family protein [Parasalinivibrio latis]|uniref:lysophospholipid acyltransferase family protein n=1 Tax=Parasalinivibrio latis TaxID=2952610 RepID=UPI0030E0613E